MRYLVLLPLLLVGCRTRGDLLADVPASSARLTDVELVTVGAVAGAVSGSANLEIDGPDGKLALPVALRGSTFGALVDVAPVIDFGIPVEIDLSGVPDATGNDLIGRYHGSEASMVVGLGISSQKLTNRSGAKLDRTYFAVGVGFGAGVEWLGVWPNGDGATADDTDGGDTADTGDSGA